MSLFVAFYALIFLLELLEIQKFMNSQISNWRLLSFDRLAKRGFLLAGLRHPRDALQHADGDGLAADFDPMRIAMPWCFALPLPLRAGWRRL